MKRELMHRVRLVAAVVAAMSMMLCGGVRAQEGTGDKVISKGESIMITVKRHSDMDRVVTVNADGEIDIPLIGKIKVDGLSMSKFREMVTTALSDYIKDPEVDVSPAFGMSTGTATATDEEGARTIKVFPLKNSDAVALVDSLRGAVSSHGTIAADKSSNSIIVSDSQSSIDAVAKIVDQLDSMEKKTRQVLIEAEIVELTVTDQRDMTIDYFMQHISRDDFFGKYNRPIALPAAISAGSGNIGRNVLTVSDVLLPQLGDGGNFFFGKVIGKNKYSAYVNALIDLNKAKILARPKIIVENNQKANIQIVTSYPYRELSGSGIVLGANSYVFTTKFLDYGIMMPVLPSIKENGMVNILIEPEVSFIQGFVENIPIRVARRTSTQVNVMNNGTLVIGGMINERTVNNARKVPVLGDMPFVGTFFRTQSKDTEKTELLIFVTPRIVDDGVIADTGKKAEAVKERIMKTKPDCAPFFFDEKWGQKKKSEN
ncbi:MAG TPA: polysaccharide biosynthesis/export family protein [bacterium]|nr:polysaccharide biosynthesis/export family protein [bacterium]